MVKVSVITPAYNSARTIDETIASVASQTFSDWEMLIVDDGSKDNTREIVAPWLERHPEQIMLFSQENKGPGAARNNALARARGEFIAILDSDDIWLPQRLEEGLKPFADPGVGLTHADCIWIDPAGRTLGTAPRDRRLLSGRIAATLYTRQSNIISPTVMFRRSCLEAAGGGFDESLSCIADRDLWLRIAEHTAIHFIDQVLAYYRRTTSSISTNAERMFQDQVAFLNKHAARRSDCYTPRLRRRALAQVYKEKGDAHGQLAQRRQCLASYLRALGCNPLRPLHYYLVLKSLLP